MRPQLGGGGAPGRGSSGRPRRGWRWHSAPSPAPSAPRPRWAARVAGVMRVAPCRGRAASTNSRDHTTPPRARDAARTRDVEQADGDDGGAEARPLDRAEHDGGEQRREGEAEVRQAHHRLSTQPRRSAASRPQRHAARDADAHRDQADRDRGARRRSAARRCRAPGCRCPASAWPRAAAAVRHVDLGGGRASTRRTAARARRAASPHAAGDEVFGATRAAEVHQRPTIFSAGRSPHRAGRPRLIVITVAAISIITMRLHQRQVAVADGLEDQPPRPGSETSFSITTVPVTRLANFTGPITVSTGTMALRSTWPPQHRARATGPLARGAHEVLAQHVEHRRAREARQDGRPCTTASARPAAPARAGRPTVRLRPRSSRESRRARAGFTANSMTPMPNQKDPCPGRHHAEIAGRGCAPGVERRASQHQWSTRQQRQRAGDREALGHQLDDGRCRAHPSPA